MVRSMRKILERTDVQAGNLFIGVAVLGFWLTRDLDVGTLGDMRTGYFPRFVCWALLLLGLAVAVRGLCGTGDEQGGAPVSRAVVLIPASIIVFGYALEPLGMVIATLLTVLVAGFAARDLRLGESVLAAVVLMLVCSLIFVWGLSSPM